MKKLHDDFASRLDDLQRLVIVQDEDDGEDEEEAEEEDQPRLHDDADP